MFEILLENRKFFDKNRNFAQKMFLKNQIFPQNPKLCSKIDMVVAKVLSVAKILSVKKTKKKI